MNSEQGILIARYGNILRQGKLSTVEQIVNLEQNS